MSRIGRPEDDQNASPASRRKSFTLKLKGLTGEFSPQSTSFRGSLPGPKPETEMRQITASPRLMGTQTLNVPVQRSRSKSDPRLRSWEFAPPSLLTIPRISPNGNTPATSCSPSTSSDLIFKSPSPSIPDVIGPQKSQHFRGLQESATPPHVRVLRQPLSRVDSTTYSAPSKEARRDDLVVEELSGGRERLKGGTIQAIILALINGSFKDAIRTQKSFFICYRTIMTPPELWDVVTSYFIFEKTDNAAQEEQRKTKRKEVVEFIKDWLDECGSEDFFSVEGKLAPPLWKSTQQFLKQLQVNRYTDFAKTIVEKIQACVQRDKDQRNTTEDDDDDDETSPQSVIEVSSGGGIWGNLSSFGVADLYSYIYTAPSRNQDQGVDLLGMHPAEICSALTTADFAQFRTIKITELLNKTWEKQNTEAKSVIHDLTQRFERMAFWVATEVASTGNLAQRKAVLEQFILVCEKCFLLNNFNGTMAILAGLNNSSVSRMKKTWAELPPRTKSIFDKLDQIMSPLNNFKNYRELLEKLKPTTKPLLPYIALILRDITFVHENPTYLEGKILNFSKWELLGKHITELRRFQKVSFQLAQVDEAIQSYFKSVTVIRKEEELYKLSLQSEPRVSEV